MMISGKYSSIREEYLVKGYLRILKFSRETKQTIHTHRKIERERDYFKKLIHVIVKY